MFRQVLPNDCISRLRHSSGPSTVASKSRRNSVQSLGFPSPPGYLPTTSTLQKMPEKTKRAAFASFCKSPKKFSKIFGRSTSLL